MIEKKVMKNYQRSYLDYVLPDDIEDDGVRRYLDKQTFKYVEVSKELEEKVICAFVERLNKKDLRKSQQKKLKEKENIRTIY